MKHKQNKFLDYRHRRILAFIEDHTKSAGYPPSYAEIADACGLPTVGHVQYRIGQLEAWGYVARRPRRARSLRVLRAAPPTKYSSARAVEPWGRWRRKWPGVEAMLTACGACSSAVAAWLVASAARRIAGLRQRVRPRP